MSLREITKLTISVPADDLREIAAEYDVTVEEFKNALDCDLYQWLRETAKWAAQDKAENERLERRD